ncbi:MAG: hypothetical protein LQ339_005655 [Xanthoria mediterranea]|nr:MAG: hypothetical protein LQ339_005655 [Xanthoria mediterranea]
MRTFDEDCVRDTVEMAKQQAASFDERVNSASGICSSLLNGGLANSCKKYTKGVATASAAGIGNSTSPNSTGGRECPEEKGANKGFRWSNSPSEDNQTEYARAITGVVPVLMLAWGKQRNPTIDPAWTDARLVCMRPSQVSVGSRVPKGVPQESLGGRMATGSIVWSLASVVGFWLVWIL